ncbi:VSP [Hexamita inflata]|uniref:VSP n=1 Tax=Hexamita inflata TaxID=28002 RepID=A0AA86TLS8_9EUKA|nr:VSP [Hexamita inflata]
MLFTFLVQYSLQKEIPQVSEHQQCLQNQHFVDDKCVCVQNSFKMQDSSCVLSCESMGLVQRGTDCVPSSGPKTLSALSCGDQLINLAGDACVDPSACGANAKSGRPPFQDRCVCLDFHYISSSKLKCVPACVNEAVSEDNTSCVLKTSCIVSLSGKQCVTACPTNAINNAGICECAASYYKSVNESACVKDCMVYDGSYLSDGVCVSSCPSLTLPFIDTDGKTCVADCVSPKLFSVDRTRCLTACGPNQVSIGTTSLQCKCDSSSFLSLNKSICVTSTQCGLNASASSSLCTCAGVNNLVMNKTGCTSDCSFDFGAFLNFDGTGCIENCSLSGNGPNANRRCVNCNSLDPQASFVNGTCRCPVDYIKQLGKCVQCTGGLIPNAIQEKCVSKCEDGEYLSVDGKICVQNCGELNLDLGGTKCVQTCPTNAKVNSKFQCECASGQKISADNTTCVSTACSATTPPSLQSLDFKRCLSKCPAGQFTKVGECVATCGAYFLAMNGSSCLSSCEGGSVQSGTDCVCLGTNKYVSLDKLTCVSTCKPDSYISQSKLCVNKCDSSYISFDNTTCELICDKSSGYAVNLNKTACVKSCGSNAMANTVVVNQVQIDFCQCQNGNMLIKSDGTACVTQSSCSGSESLNLEGKGCIKSCSTQNAVSISNVCRLCSSIDPNKIFNTSTQLCECQNGYEDISGVCQLITFQTCGINAVRYRRICQCVNDMFEFVPGSSTDCRCIAGFYKSADQICSKCSGTQVPNLARTSCVANDKCFTGYLSFNSQYCVPSCGSKVIDLLGLRCNNVCNINEKILNGRCICNDTAGFTFDNTPKTCVCSKISKFNFINAAGDFCTECDTTKGFNTATDYKGNCLCVTPSSKEYVSADKTECVSDCSAQKISAFTKSCLTDCTSENTIAVGSVCKECKTQNIYSTFDTTTKTCVCTADAPGTFPSCTPTCGQFTTGQVNPCVCNTGFTFVTGSLTTCWCATGKYLKNPTDTTCSSCVGGIVPNYDRTKCVQKSSCAPGWLNSASTWCLADCVDDLARYGDIQISTCVSPSSCGIGTKTLTNPNRCVCDASQSFVLKAGQTTCTKCAETGQVPNVDGTVYTNIGTDCIYCDKPGFIPNTDNSLCVCDFAGHFIVGTNPTTCVCAAGYAGKTSCQFCEGKTPFIDEQEFRCTECDVSAGFVSDSKNGVCFCNFNQGYVTATFEGGKPKTCIKCTGNLVPVDDACSDCSLIGPGQIQSNNTICVCDKDNYFVDVFDANKKWIGCRCDWDNNYAGGASSGAACALCEGATPFRALDNFSCRACNQYTGFSPDLVTDSKCVCANPAQFIFGSRCVDCDTTLSLKPDFVNGKCKCVEPKAFDVKGLLCVDKCTDVSTNIDGYCKCSVNATASDLACVCNATYTLVDSTCVCTENQEVNPDTKACQCVAGYTLKGPVCTQIVKAPIGIIAGVVAAVIIIGAVAAIVLVLIKKGKIHVGKNKSGIQMENKKYVRDPKVATKSKNQNYGRKDKSSNNRGKDVSGFRKQMAIK